MVHDFFISAGVQCSGVDFGVYGKGIWDDSDIIIKDKKISIKSAASFSNLLLLERKDWDDHGRYIPNINSGTSDKYDYFVLVRFAPDIKTLFRKNKVFYSDEIPEKQIESIITGESWMYDIAGYKLQYINKNDKQ